MIRFLALLLLTLATLAPPAAATGRITVFAAASLRDALGEIAQAFPGAVTLSFAGSGTLARQIAAGAPADAVVLAHPDWADWLAARGALVPGSRAEVAGGSLVLIAPAGTPDLAAVDGVSLLARLAGGRLAIGQRDGVPAGSYARDWLRHIGAWDTLAPHLAETDNVRAALALVAQGAAPLGVVYTADARAEPRVRVLHAVPPDSHPPIRYPAAATTDAGLPFVAFLQTPAAAAIFAAHGFSAP